MRRGVIPRRYCLNQKKQTNNETDFKKLPN